MIADGGGCIKLTATDCPLDSLTNDQKLWKAETSSFGSSDPAYAYNPWIRLNPQLQETCTPEQVALNLDAAGKIIDPTACFKVGPKYYRSEQGVTLLEGMQTFLGQTNHIEWGKQPYAGVLNGPKNENGGIAGIVHYAITRAENDPRSLLRKTGNRAYRAFKLKCSSTATAMARSTSHSTTAQASVRLAV